jgi:hypothetical protein
VFIPKGLLGVCTELTSAHFCALSKKHVTKVLDLAVTFLTPSDSRFLTHSLTPTHLSVNHTTSYLSGPTSSTTMAQLVTNILAFVYEYFFIITVGALFLVFAILFQYLNEQEPPAPKRQVRKAE